VEREYPGEVFITFVAGDLGDREESLGYISYIYIPIRKYIILVDIHLEHQKYSDRT
jgi:hypothetical protein